MLKLDGPVRVRLFLHTFKPPTPGTEDAMALRSVNWSQLLVEAVHKPGVVSRAYNLFWNYSIGNQLLAWSQCALRDLLPGPLNTFVGWKALGRHVKKGERALTLCMPIVCPKQSASSGTPTNDTDDGVLVRFIYRPHWFVFAQTEGAEYAAPSLPDWDESRALATLDVRRVPFESLDGNCQGYAAARTVAVSPIAFTPHRTEFHELAHVLLEHTAEGRLEDDDSVTPRNIREVEAESVALLCCESLGLEGSVFSRGYIQHWLRGAEIPERSAQRIFRAADRILKAGRPADAATHREDA